MSWTSINSSMIAAFDYREESGDLDILYTSGKTYTHSRVPPHLVEGLAAATSPGQYYHAHIKLRY